jgi:hypothetical protein
MSVTWALVKELALGSAYGLDPPERRLMMNRKEVVRQFLSLLIGTCTICTDSPPKVAE